MSQKKNSQKLFCANPICQTRDDQQNWGGGRPLPSWVDRAALAEALRNKPTKHRDRVCLRCGNEQYSKRNWPPDLVLGTNVVNVMFVSRPRDCVIERIALLPWTCSSGAVILPSAQSPVFLPFSVYLVSHVIVASRQHACCPFDPSCLNPLFTAQRPPCRLPPPVPLPRLRPCTGMTG